MYETITGEKVKGTVIRKYERTMSVLSEQGGIVLCRLVGKPDKRTDFSIEGFRPNFENAALRKKVKVIEPNGTTKIYDSVGDVANTYHITRQTVSLGCKTGNTTRHGKARGFQFSWAD